MSLSLATCLQGFTTGTLQNHARKYSVAIDTLSFGFTMLDADDVTDINLDSDVPEDGVLVYGLFMDGARWDKEKRLLGELIDGLFDACIS